MEESMIFVLLFVDKCYKTIYNKGSKKEHRNMKGLEVKNPIHSKEFISAFGENKFDYLKRYGYHDPLIKDMEPHYLVINIFNLFDEFYYDKDLFLKNLAKKFGNERFVVWNFFDPNFEYCREQWFGSTPEERLKVDKDGYVLLTHVCEAEDLDNIKKVGLIPFDQQNRESYWEDGNRAENSTSVVYLANNFTNSDMSVYGNVKLTVRVKASEIKYNKMNITDVNLFKYDEYVIDSVDAKNIVKIEFIN